MDLAKIEQIEYLAIIMSNNSSYLIETNRLLSVNKQLSKLLRTNDFKTINMCHFSICNDNQTITHDLKRNEIGTVTLQQKKNNRNIN